MYGGVDLYRSCCIQLHYLHFGVMWNSVLTARFSLTGRSSAAKQYRSSFGFFHTAFFLGFVVGCGKLGKVVEIDESCFSTWKCSCSMLRATAWVFVSVEQESERTVLHLLLIAEPRHCFLSLRRVSFPAPQSSVTAGISKFHLGSEEVTHPAIEGCFIFMDSVIGAHTDTVEATWKNVKVHLRLYWERKI